MDGQAYLATIEGEVDARDIAALLAELQDVGGTLASVDDTGSARPYSGAAVRRGVVGSTSVFKDQQSSASAATGFLRRTSHDSNGGGDANGGTTPSHRRAVLGRVGPRASLTHVGNAPAPSSLATAAAALAPVGFSTYSTADAGLTDAQVHSQRLAATPLGVRLTPLDVGATAESGHGNGARAGARGSLVSQSNPPLPSTPSARGAGGAGAGATPTSAPRRSSLSVPSALPPLPGMVARSSVGQVHDLAHLSASGGGVYPWPMGGGMGAVADAAAAAAATAADAVAATAPTRANDADALAESVPREVNFLPIMCARYLRPVGLTPSARWGHTLTPITPDTMLLFGGLDLHGEETTALMAFNTATIAWEPLFTMSSGPAARHSHAACAYDGRYLIISGGVAHRGGAVLDDIHMFDLHTHQWRCVWDGASEGSAQNRNEPGPRFGHTMLLQEDRLYLYGGKTVNESRQHARRGSTSKTHHNSNSGGAAAAMTAAATLVSGADVFVFSLSTFRWRRRLRAAKERRAGAGAGGRSSSTAAAEGADDDGEGANPAGDEAAGEADGDPQLQQQRTRPLARSFHAACLKDNTMYISGGTGATAVLTDTWSVHLSTGEWHCIHRGGTADAVPREKHAMFVCGEALLLVGGCSGGGSLHERITGKFTHFAVVLPLVGIAASTPCWIPVAMGNLSIVQPHKKGFAAALNGGFVYVFGGVCGAEPATNSMVRLLAADGYVSQNDGSSAAAGGGGGGANGAGGRGAQQLRLVMQQLREQHRGTPFDCYAYAGTYGSADVASAVAQLPAPWASAGAAAVTAAGGAVPAPSRGAEEDVPIVGLHRAIVHQRAPLLLQQLEACRSESVDAVGPTGAAKAPRTQQQQREGGGDEVDTLLQEVADGKRGSGAGQSTSAAPVSSTPAGGGGGAVSGLPVYFTNGTARVAGLAQPLSAEALQCVVDYVYWGGLKGKYRVLLEEERDEADNGGGVSHSFSAEYRAGLVQTLERVKVAGEAYGLAPLAALCAGLLAGSREKVQQARQTSSEQLCRDMAALLSSTASGANTTMLVVDPHTKAQAAHALHACVLLAASDLFTELLRPLYRAAAGVAGGGAAANQVGPLAAKLSPAAAASGLTLLTSNSRRTVLIGPVPLPLPAVQPILRYLYTQQLQVSPEIAFEVMLGAHQLGLTELQALCEAVVAREEVNYHTCCSFYYLARKYQASLLEEMALLTAVSGYAEVRFSPAYQSLTEEERQNIDAVAAELGSATWVPPPQPTQEMKPKAAYHARWEASAP